MAQRTVVKKRKTKLALQMLQKLMHIPTGKSEPKNPTNFVLRMNILKSMIKSRLLWDSALRGTYVKAKHGELK